MKFNIFKNILWDFQTSKQKINWLNCLIAFSGGQDSINLFILWINLFNRIEITNTISIIWCHHFWKKKDFYLLRHTFQMSFFFNQTFFYTFFFSKNLSEQKARHFRYCSLTRIAYYSKKTQIFTAHTQNDIIETFFINLFRGSGKIGLHALRDSQIFFNINYFQNFD